MLKLTIKLTRMESKRSFINVHYVESMKVITFATQKGMLKNTVNLF